MPEHVSSDEHGNQGRVVAAFPATGKSHYADLHDVALDSDSSLYSWTPGQDRKVRHPDWPTNYMEHIKASVAAGITVLVSSHAEVRQALAAEGIPFTLVYPAGRLLDEYIDRMVQRGSPDALIRVIAENWGWWLADCMEQEGCDHVVLGPGQYLSDVIA